MKSRGFWLRLANVAIGKNATFATRCGKKPRAVPQNRPVWAFRRAGEALCGGETVKGCKMFWILAGVATLAAWALIWRALSRAATGPRPEGEADLAVYRAQLAEVGRDLERGAIGAGEAEALRLEIKSCSRLVQNKNQLAGSTMTFTIFIHTIWPALVDI